MRRVAPLLILILLCSASGAGAAPPVTSAPAPVTPAPAPVTPGQAPVDPFQAPANPPPSSTVPTTAPGSAGTGSGGGLGTAGQVVLYGIGALILGGIAFVIVRDARRAAPARHRVHDGLPAGGDTEPGRAARPKPRTAGRKLSPAERRRRKRGRAR